MQLKEWLGESSISSNKTLATVAATIFLNEDNIKEAFKAIKTGSNMEQLVCAVFFYVSCFSVAHLLGFRRARRDDDIA
jgi:hypothetical protein